MHTLGPDLYAAILRAAPDAVLVVDDTGHIVFANDAVQAVFGRSSASLLGATIEELLPASMRSRHRAQRHGYHAKPSARAMGARMDIVGLHGDGREVPLEVSLSPVVADGGNFTICIARDATERRAMVAQLRELSYRDALTGLFSRGFFEAEVARLDVGRTMPVACFVFDIDSLKAVNDTFGHAAGDELIVRTAQLLRGCLRGEDMLARTGGDEFVALLPSMSDAAAAATTQRIDEALAQQLVPDGASPVRVSMGCALALAPPIAAAIRIADERMYTAKRAKAQRRNGGPADSPSIILRVTDSGASP